MTLAPSSQSDDWKAYGAPPSRVPTAKISNIELRPSQYLWRVDGVVISLAPKGGADVDVNDLPSSLWSRPTITLNTNVHPLRARLTYFNLVKPGSTPATDQGEVSDCEATSDACSLSATRDGAAIRINRVFDSTTLELLTVEFATLEKIDHDQGMNSYTVSWVVRAGAS